MNVLLTILLLVSPPSLDDAQVATLNRIIPPQLGEESWEQIPWRTSLGDARRTATAAGKPILLWEMDGHPLGCT